MAYSPVAALNRTYALSKARNKETAIEEAEKLKLTGNHFYFVLLGELHSGRDRGNSKKYFEQALMLAKTKRISKRSRQNCSALMRSGQKPEGCDATKTR